MTRVRDESTEAGTPMRQEDISRVVLGKKKGYLRGFGVGPKPSSCDYTTTKSVFGDEN